MTWFKVDDSYYDHPKVFDAPDCAVALWTRAGTWSARNLTEGFVPSGMPARLCDDPDTAIRELVRRGLWSRASGGYQFHDWHVYQPSAESVRELRAKRAAAGKAGGQAKARKQTASKRLASASPVAKQNATPTRPPLKGEGRRDVVREETEGVTDSMPAAQAQAAIRATLAAARRHEPIEPTDHLVEQELEIPWPPQPTAPDTDATATPPTAHTNTDPPAAARSAPANASATSNPTNPRPPRRRPQSAQDQPSPPAEAASPPPAQETATPAAGEAYRPGDWATWTGQTCKRCHQPAYNHNHAICCTQGRCRSHSSRPSVWCPQHEGFNCPHLPDWLDPVWIATPRRGVQAHRPNGDRTTCRRSTRTGTTIPAGQAETTHNATWCTTCWPEAKEPAA